MHGAPSKAPALLWRGAGARRFAAQQRRTRTTGEGVRAPLVRACAPAAAARAGALERRAPAAPRKCAGAAASRRARAVAAAGGQLRARGRTGARFQGRPSCDSYLSRRPLCPSVLHERRPAATFGMFEVFGACASRCFTRQLCLAQRKQLQAVFTPPRRRREQACWAAPPAWARAASRKAASAAWPWAPARWWRRTGGTRR